MPIAAVPTVSDLQRRLSSLETDLEKERKAHAEERQAHAEERSRREHLEWKLKDLTELYGRDDFNEGRAIGALAVAVEYLNGRFEGTPL